jgi:VIT1/CCC1 family predicted Fe2+/Mn2+ transporter
MSGKEFRMLYKAQKNEITELLIYSYLAKKEKSQENKEVLNLIIEDEKKHYEFLKSLTKKDVKPDKCRVFLYIFLAKLLGKTFALKLMEKGEKLSQKTYAILEKYHPEFANIFHQEQKHERMLLNMLKEEKLEYVGSFILGLNDALVELTGALAGLTLSLVKTKLIAFVGLITGIAASLSMAASEYLSTKEEETRNPLSSAFVTGLTYFLTVLILVSPFFIFKNNLLSLLSSLLLGSGIILGFNYYISVVKNISFKERFLEMLLISFGVAAFNFILGFLIKKYFNIEI